MLLRPSVGARGDWRRCALAAVEEPLAPSLIADDARRWFDEQCRALLGLSGDEFLARLDAGAYADLPDDVEHADILYLATLQAVGRPQR
jgi:hypothetical protein